jgi:hypothetical protein
MGALWPHYGMGYLLIHGDASPWTWITQSTGGQPHGLGWGGVICPIIAIEETRQTPMHRKPYLQTQENMNETVTPMHESCERETH